MEVGVGVGAEIGLWGWGGRRGFLEELKEELAAGRRRLGGEGFLAAGHRERWTKSEKSSRGRNRNFNEDFKRRERSILQCSMVRNRLF